jgi:hypothetical protein
VDEIIHLSSALESWDVPASINRVAYILDVTDTPELLGVGHKALTPDSYIKKEVTQFFPGSETVLIAQCQDAWMGPTGSTAEKSLAKLVIFDSDEPVLCRRSNLTCAGCYNCLLAADDFLDNCQRWDQTDEPHLNVSAYVMAAKAPESTSVAAVTSACVLF